MNTNKTKGEGKTEYIYSITPSDDGFNVYMSTKELYGIEPIKGKLLGWFPKMKDAEKFCEIEMFKHGMIKDIKDNKFTGEEINF